MLSAWKLNTSQMSWDLHRLLFSIQEENPEKCLTVYLQISRELEFNLTNKHQFHIKEDILIFRVTTDIDVTQEARKGEERISGTYQVREITRTENPGSTSLGVE